MDHALIANPPVQLSCLEEPEATLAVRLTLLRGDPIAHVSYTITRPDDSWLACRVTSCLGGPAQVRPHVASLTFAGMRDLFSIIGPF